MYGAWSVDGDEDGVVALCVREREREMKGMYRASLLLREREKAWDGGKENVLHM